MTSSEAVAGNNLETYIGRKEKETLIRTRVEAGTPATVTAWGRHVLEDLP